MLNGQEITSQGSQQYNSAVVLGADTTLTGSDIIFADTINSANLNNPRSLTLNAQGLTSFNKAVGFSNPLKEIITDSLGTTIIDGGIVTTTGAQTYGDNVILGADTIFNATNLHFANKLNSNGEGISNGIILNVTGNTIFDGAVGGDYALAGLTTDTLGKTYINGGSITTTGAQFYQEPVILGADTTLTGSGIGVNSDSLFSSRSLTVNSSGNTIFGAIIGGDNPLQNLVTDSVGTTYLDSPAITTVGSQIYNDPIILHRNISLAAAGDINFNSTINGPYNLFLDTNNNILFNGGFGAYAEPIGAIYIKNAYNVISNAATYVTAFIQKAGSGITMFNNLLYVGAGNKNEFVHVTGEASIETNKLIANVDLGSLYIGVNSTQLSGLVHGYETVKAVDYIKAIHDIPSPGTHFFRKIDLYGLALQGVMNNNLVQLILDSLKSNYNYGFGYEFLGNSNNSELDYMLLLNPLECSVSEN